MILKKEGRRNVAVACKITADIFKKLIFELKKHSFETEADIFRWLRKETYKQGCNLAFWPVIATAKNGYEIHHKPNETKLKKGFLVVDFGVKYKGFCADCTRTIYLGKPSKGEVKLYNLVLMAQKSALQEVKTGAYAADIDAVARAALADYLFSFVHSAGHGVGKKVHKAPRVSPRSKSVLKEGDIIAVEPGLYFKDKFGIRIEDTVLVGKKAIILTKITKDLIFIKR
jgi:Xaa-Pro aminopeptidase